MTCDYCKGKTLISKTVNEAISYIGSPIEETETDYIVFIRGNYLCLGDKDDGNCVDHTEHITIKYCPICGEKVNQL